MWGVLSHLAGFLTVGVKGHLLGSQLAACVYVIAEVDLPERPTPQELSLSPVDWRPRRCRNKTPHDENPAVIHLVAKLPRGWQIHCDILIWENTRSVRQNAPQGPTITRTVTSPRPDVKNPPQGFWIIPTADPLRLGNPWYASKNHAPTESRQNWERACRRLSSSQAQTLRLYFVINRPLCGRRVRQFSLAWARKTPETNTSTSDCWAVLLFHDKDNFWATNTVDWLRTWLVIMWTDDERETLPVVTYTITVHYLYSLWGFKHVWQPWSIYWRTYPCLVFLFFLIDQLIYQFEMLKLICLSFPVSFFCNSYFVAELIFGCKLLITNR